MSPLLTLALWLTPLAQAPPPPPPPPVRKEPEKPKTPERIRVGCQPSSAYHGPAEQWYYYGASLSDAQIAELEAVVASNPDDRCARAYLIAHGHQPNPLEHILWMIDHHPDWDGFIHHSHHHPSVHEAWLRQTGPNQHSASALQNAAHYFERDRPDFAESLLERAIELEPQRAPLFWESLGRLYSDFVRREEIYTRAERESGNSGFAAYALAKLNTTSNAWILAGALRLRAKDVLPASLRGRMTDQEIRGLPALPSRDPKFQTGLRCPVVPLLKICRD